MSIQHAQCNADLAVALLVDRAPPVGLFTSKCIEGGKEGKERVTTNQFILHHIARNKFKLGTLCRIGGSQDIVWVGTLDSESRSGWNLFMQYANRRKYVFFDMYMLTHSVHAGCLKIQHSTKKT